MFTYDLFSLVWLSGFYLILKKNNFVQPWRVFKVKALNLELGQRVRFYYSSLFICSFYFRKKDHISSLDLYMTIGERELLPKGVKDLIRDNIDKFFTKAVICLDPRRAAALNIAIEELRKFKNSNGTCKYSCINQYFVDMSIQQTIQQNENCGLEQQNEDRERVNRL